MSVLSIVVVEDDTTGFLVEVWDRLGTGDTLTIVTNGEEAVDVLHRRIAGERAVPDGSRKVRALHLKEYDDVASGIRPVKGEPLHDACHEGVAGSVAMRAVTACA